MDPRYGGARRLQGCRYRSDPLALDRATLAMIHRSFLRGRGEGEKD